MKELSIEEKAKAYDEALKIARQYWNDRTMPIGTNFKLEKMFPELKESKDERIRKGLIALLKFALEDGSAIAPGFNETKEQALAWIEKQGEHDSIEEPNFFDDFRNSDVEVDSNEDGLIAETIRYKKEKQGEQKPADKVESKFHVNEWVVTDKNDVAQIKAVNNGYYTIDNGMDFNMPYVDRYWHKWTIKDAKAGDVLSYSDIRNNVWVGIFEKYANERVYDYCTLDKESFWERSNWNYLASFSYTPATKEQRDSLFKAIDDAGYKWDADKKVLRKIEDEEYDGKDYGIDSLWHAKNILEETLGKVDGYQSDDGILEHKCAISAVNKLYIQKPVWSEEDEKILKDIITDVKFEGYNNDMQANSYKKISWLKALKDRYTWIPSDAQVASINCAVRKMKESACYDSELVHLLQDLKKLREE